MRATLVAVLLAGAVGAPVASAKPERPGKPRATNLLAAGGLLLQVNRQQCGIDNIGQVCVQFAGSPVGGGGFWPKGTPDQYIFNSGLQLVGTVPTTATFGGPGRSWAGDTIGVYFFDARGGQNAGDGISLVYNRLSPADVASWPQSAIIRDASIYNPVLIGLPGASQGDAWVRYWEGDPAFLTGRPHPMGILVDERALAWNFPTGNEDILYFVFTFYNVTAKDRTKYTSSPTIPTELRDSIADIGERFQALNENKFKVDIPDTGYTIKSVFAAFSMDADVAVFSQNYASAVLPFNIGMEYSGTFLPDAGWIFPPDIFGAPFAPAVGFIGVKYLKAPVPQGITMFSQTFNPNQGFGLIDPNGVNQLYRYLSGFLGPSDNPCSVGTPATARSLHLCYLGQIQGDARFFQASGPFDLNPGEARSIVVAYINAAPVKTPDLVIGGDLPPGVPASGAEIAADPTLVRPIEKIAGWVSQSDTKPPTGVITQDEVVTVPRSLLNKALIAQNVFDAGFLLPFAPDAPNFFLVPGDNQVTVVWQQSPTETFGDPYFLVASAPTTPSGAANALYDPNFRRLDVEGYRIYRGRTSSQLTLVAQFDYASTIITDYTGAFDYGSGCAPELVVTSGCPVTFAANPVIGTSPHVDHPLVGDVVQVGLGGRVKLADGSVLVLRADTAVTNQQCADVKCPALTDGGVPFAFVDHDVRNSFTYFYTVTAFDVNSLKSTPSSLESPRVTKAVVPRRPSGQAVGASLTSVQLLGAAGEVLDPTAAVPTLTGSTGIFSGPMPPADGIQSSLAAFASELITGGTVTITIDSVVPGHANEGDGVGPIAPARYYVTSVGPIGTLKTVMPVPISGSSGDASTIGYLPVTALDAAKAAPFKGDPSYSLYSSLQVSSPGTWRLTSWGRGDINSDPTRSYENGPRWWAGAANENTPRPNSKVCVPTDGGCIQADLSLNAGAITGVDIFHPQAYSTVPNTPMRAFEAVLSTVTRAADFSVYWGTAGIIDSVIDDVHKIPARFNAKIRAGWGILNGASFAATPAAQTPDGNNGRLTWTDIACVNPIPAFTGECVSDTTQAAVLMDHAELSPIVFASSKFAEAGTFPSTGNGFIFYLNGHFFLMQMASLPAKGTVWHARFYSGNLRWNATFTSLSFRCGTGAIGLGCIRPPAVPGLRARFTFQGSTFDPSKTNDSLLARVHTVPDPYYVANALEITANSKVLKFVNVPAKCIIRIYSVSGVLVAVVAVNDPTGGGEVTWNLRNRNNQFVASGVYFYHVETPDGRSKIGRFTIVNFAP